MPQYELGEIVETGVPGLDSLLHGGIPRGHVVLLTGDAGTGKTTLAMQWLFNGFTKYDDPGIYLAVTEPVTKALRNISTTAFYDQDVLDEGNLHFTDLRSMTDLMGFERTDLEQGHIDEFVDNIADLVEETGAKRLVIDSITALGYRIGDKKLFRYLIFRLGTLLATKGCTIMLPSEMEDGETPFHIEDFISDGIIHLENNPGEQKLLRHLIVTKMRGVNYRSGRVNMEINEDGVRVYPKIPVDLTVAETDFDNRRSTGIPKLDELTGGGYPQGHMILVGGNTGTGKSTMGMQYIIEGVENGEPGIIINMEESTPQVKKMAAQRGWDLDAYIDDGLLRFVTPRLIDTYQDKFLYQIMDAVDDIGAERVFLDSVSALRSEALSDEKVRQILLQLTSAFKTRGITALMTYMTSEMFSGGSQDTIGGIQVSKLRLSSVTDGIILLRYVEQENTVQKALNVLKMRGSDHSKDIWQFDITSDGIEINSSFTS